MRVKELKEKLEGFDDDYEIVFREDQYDSDLELIAVHYRSECQLWFDCKDLIELKEELDTAVNHKRLTRNDLFIIDTHVEDIFELIDCKSNDKKEWVARAIRNEVKERMNL